MKILKWIGMIAALLGAVAFAYVQLILVPQTDASMNAVTDHAPYRISERAQALHDRLYIADLHADALLWRRNPAKRQSRGQVDLPRLREGGVEFQVFSTVTKSPRGLNFAGNAADAPDDITMLAQAQLWPIRTWGSIYERAAYQAQRLQKVEAKDSNNFVIARSRADLDQPEGTLVGLLLTEGSHPLEGDLDNIDRLFDEGYRAMGLQHFFDNELGGSLHGESKAGLSEFGRKAVRKMWDMSISVDVAHSSEQTVRDVLALGTGPVFISHGGVRGGCDVTRLRNLPDDILKQIAARSGILGVGYFEGAICDTSPAGIADAIVKAIGVMGEDAVALGSDFDGSVVTRLDTSELAAITQALLDKGVSDRVIAKVMGENARQFFQRTLPE